MLWRGEEMPALPKVPGIFKDPAEFKSQKMSNELEQLRQKGLANKLSTYFTKEVEAIAMERAATEAALRELEARKAAATRKSASSSNEMTQLDAMYSKLQNRKKEADMREKEALMLYQRSLTKYGNNVIKISSPENLLSPDNKILPARSVSPDAPAGVSDLAEAFEVSADHNGPPNSLKPSMEELEEIQEDACLPDPDGRVVRCESPRAETPVTAVDSEAFGEDELSIVSGLTTLNSAKTREVLHDVGSQVEGFIKHEKDQIKKLLEEESSRSVASRTRSYVGSVSEDSAKASEAEHMVQRMNKILEDFRKQEDEMTKKAQGNATGPRRIEGGNTNGEWYEHFDQTYQRHYYVEAKTQKSQWHAPPFMTELSGDNSSSMGDSTTVVSIVPSLASIAQPTVPDHEDFKPQVRNIYRTTRIDRYRAKRRRQRNRAIVVGSVFVVSLISAFVYYKQGHPGSSLLDFAPQGTEQHVEQLIHWANSVQKLVKISTDKVFPTRITMISNNVPLPEKGFVKPELAPKKIEAASRVPTPIKTAAFDELKAVQEEAVVMDSSQPMEKRKENRDSKVRTENTEGKKMEKKSFVNHLVQTLSGPLYFTTEYLEKRGPLYFTTE